MSWTLDTPDRSFQFGRLLAVMERAELDHYRNIDRRSRRKADDEDGGGKKSAYRQTYAIKAMSDYKSHPWTIYERVNHHLQQAYLPRINGYQLSRYNSLCGEIVSILATFPAEELDKPLDATYLLGYDLQRNEFYKRNNNTENTEEDTENE